MNMDTNSIREIMNANITAAQREKLTATDYVKLFKVIFLVYTVIEGLGLPAAIRNKLIQHKIHKEMKKELKILIGE